MRHAVYPRRWRAFDHIIRFFIPNRSQCHIVQISRRLQSRRRWCAPYTEHTKNHGQKGCDYAPISSRFRADPKFISRCERVNRRDTPSSERHVCQSQWFARCMARNCSHTVHIGERSMESRTTADGSIIGIYPKRINSGFYGVCRRRNASITFVCCRLTVVALCASSLETLMDATGQQRSKGRHSVTEHLPLPVNTSERPFAQRQRLSTWGFDQ